MLDSMRGLAKSFISKALMIFLVITFAVWGAGDVVRGSGENWLAQVGDTKIMPNQFVRELRSMQRAMEQMGMKGIEQQALASDILRRMIQQALVDQWRADTGLEVNRATLSQAIARAPEFRGTDGKFDPELFAFALQQRNVTEPMYLAELGEEVGGQAMLRSLDSSAIPVPESLRDLTLASGTQLRDVVLITIPPVRTPSVSDDELETYYEQNQSDFTQPERRTLEYVALDTEALKKLADAAVTDESLAAEQREQALQDIAMDIEDALAGGSSMGEAVAESGVSAQSKVLTDVTAASFAMNKDTLLRAVVQHGFELGEGETSSLQSTEDGRYFLVSVKAVTEAAPKALEEVTAEVRQAVAKEKARDASRERVATVKAALMGGAAWQEAVREGNGTGRIVTGITRPAPGSPATDGKIPALLQEAVFEHTIGGVAGPMARDNGEQVLALVTAIRTVPTAASEKTRMQAEREYKTQLGDRIGTGVFTALAARYPVTVNQPLFQQLQAGNE